MGPLMICLIFCVSQPIDGSKGNKNPNKTTVFEPSVISIGGAIPDWRTGLENKLKIHRPFRGVIANVVYNNLRLLELASDDNEGIHILGTVRELQTGIPFDYKQRNPHLFTRKDNFIIGWTMRNGRGWVKKWQGKIYYCDEDEDCTEGSGDSEPSGSGWEEETERVSRSQRSPAGSEDSNQLFQKGTDRISCGENQFAKNCKECHEIYGICSSEYCIFKNDECVGFLGQLMSKGCRSSGFRVAENQDECEKIAHQLRLLDVNGTAKSWNIKDCQYPQHYKCSYVVPTNAKYEEWKRVGLLKWNPSCYDEHHQSRYEHNDQILNLCIDESVVYEWYGNGGTITYYYPAEKTPETKDDFLVLGFITPSLDAILVRISSQGRDMHNDYLQLEIIGGKIFGRYKLGSEGLIIGDINTKVNDGNYHIVYFTKYGV